MFAAIANFLNQFSAILSGLMNVLNVAKSIPSISNPFSSNDPPQSEPQNPIETPNETKTSPATGKRSLITVPENITARFYSTGSPAWKNQPGGYHWGTDFSAPKGSAVYAPYDMTIVKVGYYADAGRMGTYVIGTLGDGTEYYSGHLDDVSLQAGNFVKSGTKIGVTNIYNHTHVQLRQNGKLVDFEEYSK